MSINILNTFGKQNKLIIFTYYYYVLLYLFLRQTLLFHLFYTFGKGGSIYILFISTCFADDIIIIIENLTISFVGKNNKEKLHSTGYNNLLVLHLIYSPSSKPQFHERFYHCF